MAVGNLVVEGSTDEFIAGIPKNNAAFYDGSNYWIFYQEAATLKCKYGSSLSSLASTFTNNTADIGGLANDGKSYSICCAKYNSTWYAYGTLGFTTGDDRFQCWRWELTSTGLGAPTKALGGQSDKTFNSAACTKDYGDETASKIFFSIADFTNYRSHNRSIDADCASNHTAEMSSSYALTTDPEWSAMLELSDGYLHLYIDEGGAGEQNGDFGHCREFRKTNLGDIWGAEQTIEAAGPPEKFQNQNYATNTSHAGQIDCVQLDDGTIYAAYTDNSDLTNGDYGIINLWQRGDVQASGWTQKSADVISSSGKAWHIALSTDGSDVWVFYIKDDNGTRDTAIYYKKYDVSEDSFGAETKLADLQAAHTFVRMCTQWRAYNQIAVVWSELGGGVYDLVAKAINIMANSSLANGCVGQWICNDNTTSSVVIDNVGSADGTYKDGDSSVNTSTGSVSGKINTALDLDTDEWIDIGNQGSSIKTIALWAKPDSVAGTDYLIDLNGTDYLTVISGTVTQNGFASGTQIIYVDGQVASTITADWHFVVLTSTIGYMASDLDIGRLENTGYFNGVVWDLMLFDRVLSPDEIKRLYNSSYGTMNLAEFDDKNYVERWNTSDLPLRKELEL
jgi:hypothetical protein